MTDSAITLKIGGATLLAVPAVHFRLPFAEAMNALCCDPATRPDAIAVELGPAAAAAARDWLLELGIGPARRRRLPCMLALHRDRRLLHPAVRERAMALQRETGSELHRVPPGILKETLDFSGLAVLSLSPTDSIVEGLRCACELDVPVYGVDLEESAGTDSAASLIEDPWLAQGAIRSYAERNARRALANTDPLIDARREAVMAARLGAVLGRHRRVLFTCGLGHWVRLTALLQDPALRPATVGLIPDDAQIATWRRTLIHPGIAAMHMEWPAITWRWERNRPHPMCGGPPGRQAPFHHPLLGKTLEHVYTRTPYAADAERGRVWSACTRFAQLLVAESRLNLRQIPDLGLVLRCAEATLPTSLSAALGAALTRFPWAKPAQFPETDVLRGRVEGTTGGLTLTSRGSGYGASLAQGGETLAPDLHLVRVAESQRGWGEPSRWSGWPSSLSWRPWERLATTLCAQASGQVEVTKRIRVTEPFTGQLLDGIDVRRTLREYARGEEQLIVRASRLAPERAPRSVTDVFPVVWIFDTGEPRGGQITALRTPVPWLLDAAQDRAAVERLREGAGGDMVDLVLFTDDAGKDSPFASDSGITQYRTRGWLLFRPQCPTLRQAADWIVQSQCRLSPTYSRATGNELPLEIRQSLESDGGPRLAELSWQDVLLRVALAFGGRALTLVAPEDFTPAPSIRGYAERRGQTIGRVPLVAFSPAHVARIRRIQLVPARVQGDEGRILYDGRPSEILDEPEDAFRELIPSEWRRYLC